MKDSITFDIADSLSSIDDGGDDAEQKLDRAEGRLDVIARLKRKYGSTVEEIIEFRNSAVKRLSSIENIDDRLEELSDELAAAKSKANAICCRLSEERHRAARKLTSIITENLSFLDMPKVRFEVGISTASDFTPTGKDKVEFLIATNVGEELMPMAKIASGGELARIMLSL